MRFKLDALCKDHNCLSQSYSDAFDAFHWLHLVGMGDLLWMI